MFTDSYMHKRKSCLLRDLGTILLGFKIGGEIAKKQETDIGFFIQGYREKLSVQTRMQKLVSDKQ